MIQEEKPKSIAFRNVRILTLLLVLLFIAVRSLLSELRVTRWDVPLSVVVYPINGDGSAHTAEYVNNLREVAFSDIERFFVREAHRHDLGLDDPVIVNLAPVVSQLPPELVREPNIFDTIVWSLQLRYWAWRNGVFEGREPDIQIFVKYFDPDLQKRLKHSVGLQKGMVSVVNAFGSPAMAGSNNVVIAHELLHTLGASDKYNPATNQPLYPLGFAEPNRQPLYPQRWAELMAGRTPVSESEAVTPSSLDEVVIGDATAIEIFWR